ncbi:DEKNAAC100767 [Brettanomyces naardenensis]|uniref:DEKNAAC100767 n=1 Tax=Brettanomyces naardenensis TaxID=13370 RepID=A0A448YEX6_BRENA|nr:DEKNAAC100767 [Brettanomyces naardenensis]
MSEFNTEDYIPTIDAILKVSELTEVTVKKIRKALEALFGEDFTEHKKEINKAILERFYELSDENEKKEDEYSGLSDREKMKKKINDLEKENRILSAQLNQGLRSQNVKDSISKRRGKHAAPSRKPPPGLRKPTMKKKKGTKTVGGSFNMKVQTTPELAEFFGIQDGIARTEAVKRLWEHIKENDLQDPQDKREIICDDKMRPVFGDRINMFAMTKVLMANFLPEKKTEGDGSVSGTPSHEKELDTGDNGGDNDKVSQ